MPFKFLFQEKGVGQFNAVGGPEFNEKSGTLEVELRQHKQVLMQLSPGFI